MDLNKVVSQFIGKRIVVVGDVMIDEYMQGGVHRISPEMPVPILLRKKYPSIEEDLIRLGGAGNTARNLASLGAEVILIGVSGKNDPASKQLRILSRKHEPSNKSRTSHRLKINCRFIIQDGLLTTHKLRVVNNQAIQLFRIDTEATQEIRESTLSALLDEIKNAAAWCDAIIVTDYAKGLITEGLVRKFKTISGAKPIIVDPKELGGGQRFRKYEGADIIIPNEAELRKSFDYNNYNEKIECLFAGEVQSSLGEIGVRGIICTRGADGIIYSECSMDIGSSISGAHVEVADVTGASDAVTAAIALAWTQGVDLAIACKIAEAVGRLKVTKRLTGTVYVSELLEALDPMFRKRAAAKLNLDRARFIYLISKLKKTRGAGARVALVTGCFDILHRGHVRLFELAAESADVVVVAVNSDSYVARSPHKTGGPYVDEVSRATLIASLSSVDLVTVFDDPSPAKLIERICPEVLVMGKEYEEKYHNGDLPGMSTIKRTNTKVIFAWWEDIDDVSSSSIAQRIKNGVVLTSE